nr:hypothetical protein CFP56_67808 [Quercus suber]
MASRSTLYCTFIESRTQGTLKPRPYHAATYVEAPRKTADASGTNDEAGSHVGRKNESPMARLVELIYRMDRLNQSGQAFLRVHMDSSTTPSA